MNALLFTALCYILLSYWSTGAQCTQRHALEASRTLAHFSAWGWARMMCLSGRWASLRASRRSDRLVVCVACAYYVKQGACTRKRENRYCGTFTFTRPVPPPPGTPRSVWLFLFYTLPFSLCVIATWFLCFQSRTLFPVSLLYFLVCPRLI